MILIIAEVLDKEPVILDIWLPVAFPIVGAIINFRKRHRAIGH